MSQSWVTVNFPMMKMTLITESDNERDKESNDDCGNGFGLAPPSSKRKRCDGEHGHEIGASSLSALHPLHDLTRQTNTASTSQTQDHTVTAIQTSIVHTQWEWTDGN
ncbi:hypothetical protein E2C01_060290 [Portunus trituberculatus]|uniref:Uncharacterized protein n=1 Tax=Portunus trituberculatus TaxID=210409 RepID=A0A5B7H921_PORTR|nr:hypothetical protein [Portunus trituberculatus]